MSRGGGASAVHHVWVPADGQRGSFSLHGTERDVWRPPGSSPHIQQRRRCRRRNTSCPELPVRRRRFWIILNVQTRSMNPLEQQEIGSDPRLDLTGIKHLQRLQHQTLLGDLWLLYIISFKKCWKCEAEFQLFRFFSKVFLQIINSLSPEWLKINTNPILLTPGCLLEYDLLPRWRLLL